MTNISAHVRIFDPEPADDLVTKRTAAVKELVAKYSKGRPVLDTFVTVNDLAAAVASEGVISENFSSEVEAAVRKTAKAFLASEAPLQVMACGLMAAVRTIEAQSPHKGITLTSGDIFAIGLWSALSFQAHRDEPRIEALRKEALETAESYVRATAMSSRERTTVPNSSFSAPADETPAAMSTAMTAGMKDVVAALRSNSAVDREELDLLWWVIADWSELLTRRYSGAPSYAGAISSGLEGGRLLRRLPALAHQHIILRNVGSADPVTLPELLVQLGEDRQKLASVFGADPVMIACPNVFPLLNALRTGASTVSGNEQARSLDEWAARALLESAALYTCTKLPSVGL